MCELRSDRALSLTYEGNSMRHDSPTKWNSGSPAKGVTVLSTRKALVTALTVMTLAFGLSVTTAMAAIRPSTPTVTSPPTTASVSALSGGQARLTSYATAQQPAVRPCAGCRGAGSRAPGALPAG